RLLRAVPGQVRAALGVLPVSLQRVLDLVEGHAGVALVAFVAGPVGALIFVVIAAGLVIAFLLVMPAPVLVLGSGIQRTRPVQVAGIHRASFSPRKRRTQSPR